MPQIALPEFTPDEPPPPYTPYAGADEQVVEEGAAGFNNPPPGRRPPRVTSTTTRLNARPMGVNRPGTIPIRPSQLTTASVPHTTGGLANSGRPIGPRPVGGGTYQAVYPSQASLGVTGRTMPWCWKCEDTGFKRPGKPCNRCARGEAARLGITTCPSCFTAPRLSPRGPCPACGTRLPPSVWDYPAQVNPLSTLMAGLAGISLEPYPAPGTPGASSHVYGGAYPGGCYSGTWGRPPLTSNHSHPAPGGGAHYQARPYPGSGAFTSGSPYYSRTRSASGDLHTSVNNRGPNGYQPTMQDTMYSPGRLHIPANPSCYLCRSRRHIRDDGTLPASLLRRLPDRCPACNADWRASSIATN
ncbi:hypothetical protein IWQ60_002155 [Tieghemiomyces parasiticus]|uniref:Uncharacterized protein n=1 Tax=Tieghemiomyces parasiticus TaxID=78921 RepID=A0A9W8DVX9_9FUNG|nr:hypothetical protein IWQ60_002155 [Tieghemiomyces parasiticus]